MPLETRQTNQDWLHRQVRRSKALCASAMFVATALTALAACGGSSPLTDDLGASGDRDTQPPSSPSATPSQDAAVPDVAIDADTTLSEIVGDLNASEQACIREELGEHLFDAAMAQPILGFLESDIGESDASLKIFNCAPDLFATSIAPLLGVDPEDMGEEERSCLRDWISGIDPGFFTSVNDEAATIEAGIAILACMPDLIIDQIAQEAGADLGPMSAEQRLCLRDWARDLDPSQLAAQDDDTAAVGIGLGMFACVPDLLISGVAAGLEDSSNEFADTGPDDHADGREDATVAAVDTAIEGEIEHLYDIDFFVFQAEAGVVYQMDVAPETMSDPLIRLYDSLGELDYSDDHEGLAPRIHWEAPTSGSYYVAVEGFDLGTYTLTIAT